MFNLVYSVLIDWIELWMPASFASHRTSRLIHVRDGLNI